MSVRATARKIRTLWRPTTELTVSEFADREIIVTTGPLAGTHWQTSFTPYLRGVLDAFHEPGIEIVVLQASSQVGKTSAAVALVAYHMAHDPCPILVVEPTVDPMAKDFARNRLNPVIEASPVLRARVAKLRARNSASTTLTKQFQGGDLAIGGANSAASLAARSRRLLVCDEVDRWPPELIGEGSTMAIAIKRTQAFRRRRRIFICSSPTMRGAPIDVWFHRGDQRRYYVPCPACGEMHVLTWANVKFEQREASTARCICPACGAAFSDAERVAIQARGEWRAEVPERREKNIVSMKLWEVSSPLSSLAEIVAGFVRATVAREAGDRSEMHTWINTTLGEPVDPDEGEGIEPIGLLLRRETYAAEVPAGACCLVLGTDVQDDRLECLVVGFGPGEESWLVDRLTLPGDTSQPEPWRMHDEVLDRTYQHTSGARLGIQATCIDSAGHRTAMVYDYCARHAARRVYATIGRDGQRPIVSSPSEKHWGRNPRPVRLYTVGVDAAKALIVDRMKLLEKGRGYIHISRADWADEEMAAQFASERLTTRWTKGVPHTYWKKIRARNEMLDCFVLALAALRLRNPRLDAMLAAVTRAGGTVREIAETVAAGGPAPVEPVPSAALIRRAARSAYLA